MCVKFNLKNFILLIINLKNSAGFFMCKWILGHPELPPKKIVVPCQLQGWRIPRCQLHVGEGASNQVNFPLGE
jgi:hypothetical protein